MSRLTTQSLSSFLQIRNKQSNYHNMSTKLCDCGTRVRRQKVKDLQRKQNGRRADILITSKDGKVYGVGESVVHNLISDLLASMVVYPRFADGRRVLHLHESGKTIYSLLRYCYSEHMFSGDRDQICHLLNVYSLARKYNLTYLKALAISSICQAYPRTIHEWQSFLGLRHPASAVEVFKIIVQEGLTSHLPAAYYALCQVDRRSLEFSDLSAKVKQQVKSGKYHLARRLERIFMDRIVRNEPFKMCQRYDKSCSNKLLQIVWTAEKMLASSRWKRDPFDSLFMVQFCGEENFCGGDSLCGGCLARVEQLLGEASQQLWDELPVLFHFRST